MSRLFKFLLYVEHIIWIWFYCLKTMNDKQYWVIFFINKISLSFGTIYIFLSLFISTVFIYLLM